MNTNSWVAGPHWNEGAFRRGSYCPNCKQIVETRVLLEGYCQTEVHGIPAKKRQIICGTDAQGSKGCGTKWFTLELPEEQLLAGNGKKRVNY